MSEVSVYDARTHFSELVARVQKGERVTITKHGQPVAALVPLNRAGRRSVAEIGESLASLRKGCRLGGLKLKDLIAAGRR